MKKTSFQIQQFVSDGGRGKWIKITRKINNSDLQLQIARCILESDSKPGLFLKEYAPIYRMYNRDKKFIYFTVNPYFPQYNSTLNES